MGPRIIITPCCKYKQSTRQPKGSVIRCTKCKTPFTEQMILKKRRSVAPVIATLLMVAIAVVGGMLVFVFAQDFFTSTDSMTGPTIEILQLYGYDARDVASPESDLGAECTLVGTTTGLLADTDPVMIYVRNLGSNDVIISDVSINNNKLTPVATNLVVGAANPDGGIWGVLTHAANDVCGITGTLASGTTIGPGRDATIIAAFGDPSETGDPVKIGRPIFIKIETSSGNIFVKQLVNGRQVG